MNYRHAYHAGNFADVHKHIALVAVLLHLRKKEKPFAVIDTHAGAGLYDLASTEALKTAEAAEGIGKLRNYAAQTPSLQHYLEIVNSFGPERYPGSATVAAKLLRPTDRLIAIEKHPEEFATLKQSLTPFRNARAMAADGYQQLLPLLPPPEHRGLILIDPPYETRSEMELVASALARACDRFSTGIFMIWHPLKLISEVQSFTGELQNAGPKKLLSLSIDVGWGSPALAGRLHAAGLLVINPPYEFDREMTAACDEILPLLRRTPDARAVVQWASAPH